MMRASAGFTLMEIVLVVAIFGMVLTTCYTILVDTLNDEVLVEKKNQEGKVGQAILFLLRQDLQSAAYDGLGREVFLGVDEGDGEEAEDALHFLTFAPVPRPPDSVAEDWMGEYASVGYVVKRGDENGNTLFRHVKWVVDDLPFENGTYFPVYSRVKGFSVRYFDGVEWYDEWDSKERIPEEPDPDLDEEEPDPDAPTPTVDDLLDEELAEIERSQLALPRAVEVVLTVYVADERGMLRDDKREPVLETHRMVIPLLAMDRLRLGDEASTSDPDEDP